MPGKLLVSHSPAYDGRHWVVFGDGHVIARFISWRAALNFALWKSGRLRNYGGA